MANGCLLQFWQVPWRLMLPSVGVPGRGGTRWPAGPLPRRCVRCRPAGRARPATAQLLQPGRPDQSEDDLAKPLRGGLTADQRKL